MTFPHKRMQSGQTTRYVHGLAADAKRYVARTETHLVGTKQEADSGTPIVLF